MCNYKQSLLHSVRKALSVILPTSWPLFSDIDEVPSPNITSLDVAENMLAWTHVFQPSDLPPDFQLVHEFTLSYLVHMTDRDDVEAATSVTVNETSFNIEDMLDTCRRQDFTVQAVIDNEPRSENSSPASGFSGKYYHTIYTQYLSRFLTVT